MKRNFIASKSGVKIRNSEKLERIKVSKSFKIFKSSQIKAAKLCNATDKVSFSLFLPFPRHVRFLHLVIYCRRRKFVLATVWCFSCEWQNIIKLMKGSSRGERAPTPMSFTIPLNFARLIRIHCGIETEGERKVFPRKIFRHYRMLCGFIFVFARAQGTPRMERVFLSRTFFRQRGASEARASAFATLSS
jgi:hypothetical protein